MHIGDGRVIEMRLDEAGRTQAWISCPKRAIPGAGQYLMAWEPSDLDAPSGQVLFPVERGADGFLAAGPIPAQWGPGTHLALNGPLGRGFRLPASARRLALAALGDGPGCLLPLLYAGLEAGMAAALFADSPIPRLPAAVEISPLSALPSALAWADFLALETRRDDLPGLRSRLGLRPGEPVPCPTEALVRAPMPCGGVAACGVCAVQGLRRNWKQACSDGPVFNLNEIEW
jgi:hypothetical protein